MNPLSIKSSSKYGLALVAVALTYFAAGKLGLNVAYIHPSASPIWAPTGIALAALILLGYDLWPAVAVGAFVLNYQVTGLSLATLGITLGNTVEAMAGAWMVNHFAHGRDAFEQPQNVLKFVLLAGFLSTTLSATMGVVSLVYGGFAPLGNAAQIWVTWWLGDVVGNLIVAPLLITWGRKSSGTWDRERTLEAALLLLTLLYVSLLVFSNMVYPNIEQYSLKFICIPPIVWTAYRFGQRETTAATMLLALASLWGTLHGAPVGALTGLNDQMVFLQMFNGVIAVMGLLLAAVSTELQRDKELLLNANSALEDRVQERTISLSRIVADLRLEVLKRKETEKTLRESQERFRLLVEAVKDYAIFMLDPNGKIISWNAGAERMKGFQAHEIIGKHFSIFYRSEDITKGVPMRMLERAIMKGSVSDVGIRVRKDGSSFWADVSMSPLRDKAGRLQGFVKVTRDVTERRTTEKALYESEARFRQLMSSNFIGFMILDDKGYVQEANEACLKLLGYPREELLDQHVTLEALTPILYHPLDEWMFDRLQASGMCPPMEKEFVRKDGARVPVLVGMVQLPGDKPQRLCFIIDATERRTAQDALRKAYDELEVRVQQRTAELQSEVFRRQRAEEELRNQAIHDSLTGIYNRRGFVALAEKHAELALGQQRPLLFFMADLDDLKQINDRFGHAEGDAALLQAAEILKKTFRQSDIISRIGGDEFAVIGLEDTGNTEVDLVGRLRATLDDYNRYSGKAYKLHLSVGTSRVDASSTFSLEALFREADTMLYEQKKCKAPTLLKTPGSE